MRKLAHIEKIIDILPIAGADRIELAKILGWQVIIKKEQFVVGDVVVYIELDSVLPKNSEYEFLEKYKYRIKTQKLRNVLSQGLILPLPKDGRDFKYNIGDDVTELLGITQYVSPSEREAMNNQTNKHHWTKKYLFTKWLWRYEWFRNFVAPIKDNSWPNWVSKTDEERIQNIPDVLDAYKEFSCSITEKIDYQSVTFTSNIVPRYNNFLGKIFKKTKFIVCSRNLINSNKNSLYWRIAKKYKLDEITKKYPKIIIQGEQGDIGVQGNKYGITEPTLWVFNVIKDGVFLNETQMKIFCDEHNLQTVPYLGNVKLGDFKSVDDIIKFVEGKSKINSKIEREGIVFRYITNGKKQLSFKVINNKFLLKHE